MRPDEFTRMLDDRPGSLKNRERPQDTRGFAKEALEASFQTFATNRQEAREQLEQSRRQRAWQFWYEAGLEDGHPGEATNEPNEATEE